MEELQTLLRNSFKFRVGTFYGYFQGREDEEKVNVKDIKKLKKINKQQKKYIKFLNEAVEYQINNVDYVVNFIDEMEDKNSQEKFTKYLLENEYFLEVYSGLFEFIQDEKERNFYIEKHNIMIDEILKKM